MGCDADKTVCYKRRQMTRCVEVAIITHGDVTRKISHATVSIINRGSVFNHGSSYTQPPSVKDKAGTKNPADNRIKKKVGSTSFSEGPQRKLPEIESFMETLPVSAYCCSCILEFDGAAKGNPGPAGAGAVLRAIDGSLVYRLREGLGVATNNAAEYRAVILGLRYALERGFRHIRVQGDSKLVCMQVNGLWKTKTQNMTSLCKVAKELKDKFASFQICHVEREFNTEADAQANLGIHLQIGEVQEEVERR
ncbi:uncharacterized protein LOC112502867 isoform X3 [Cynara cardunculus var. scolymus]|uniref:uncharacterized protein LOC112502867 isoform X3 n=1 Tax=Cynara cardunculus var. scolymus TaxID=59895 RepID=UPI000D622F42|nr:uncharacterized protein LOC112502867 isoform X3 [Cynara cardunculus var. scolymus]